MLKTKYLIHLDGEIADAGKLESCGSATYMVVGGPHDGHLINVQTAKYDCGAYSAVIRCNCGADWENEMNGCWQHGHQRPEAGDAELGRIMDGSYGCITKYGA